jgi:hypothetical protein
LDPERRAQVKSRDEYLALAKGLLVHDEIFYFNPAGESLWVDVLPLSAEIKAAAQTRWGDDPRHVALINQWSPADPPSRVILVGLYSKGLVKEDVLKNGRFRFQLQADGQTLDPLAVEEVKPEVWTDYYPVFTRWSKVFAARFPKGSGEGGGVLVVKWPAGERALDLTRPRRSG